MWIFFSAPVAAGAARRLGHCCSERRSLGGAELDLASYDRLFEPGLPSAEGVRQPDRAAAAGPLPRRRRHAASPEAPERCTSLFLNPADDRSPGPTCTVLALPIEPEELERLLADHEEVGRRHELGAYETRDSPDPTSVCPAEVRCTIGSDLADPAWSTAAVWSLVRFKHLASLHNPASSTSGSACGFSTHPDAEADSLLRGRPDTPALAARSARATRRGDRRWGHRLLVEDRRPAPEPLRSSSTDSSTAQQESAVAALLAHDGGMSLVVLLRLRAPCSARGREDRDRLRADRRAQLPTLILAHSTPLL